jgi:hypothetical protein
VAGGRSKGSSRGGSTPSDEERKRLVCSVDAKKGAAVSGQTRASPRHCPFARTLTSEGRVPPRAADLAPPHPMRSGPPRR